MYFFNTKHTAVRARQQLRISYFGHVRLAAYCDAKVARIGSYKAIVWDLE